MDYTPNSASDLNITLRKDEGWKENLAAAEEQLNEIVVDNSGAATKMSQMRQNSSCESTLARLQICSLVCSIHCVVSAAVLL